MNKGNGTKKDKSTPVLKIDNFAVKKAVCFKSSGNVLIDIEINGITIYGCSIVEGKNGDFIGWPQRKGSDGNYYNVVFAKISDDDVKDIVAEAEKILVEK